MQNVAIVVGGTSGLGAAIAELLRDSMRVVTVSRRESADIIGDASHEETVQRTLSHADSLGTIALLVNCAGLGIYGPAGSYDETNIRAMLDANLVATILFSDALLPRFKTEGGTIVNVLSTAALVAKPNESVYCAAKWGALGYTEVLKAEAKGSKARVISIAPGGMDTPFWPERREHFMDAREVANVVVHAIRGPVNVNHVVIER
ncbi:MAG TPA: SDR family oxidoreductase [Thermoanaerobaculia bacterium]|nr:SDR family oxidoreductase [Thermoanaerobaculia bacterium]